MQWVQTASLCSSLENPRTSSPYRMNLSTQPCQKRQIKENKPKSRTSLMRNKSIVIHHRELSPYLRSSERRRDEPSPRSSECRRCLEWSDFEPRDTTMGWWRGRLSCLSDSFFERCAACFSQTSLLLWQMSSICSYPYRQRNYCLTDVRVYASCLHLSSTPRG